MKEHYRVKLEDYKKTKDPMGLGNSLIKAVIYNTIMEILIYTYAGNLNNLLIDNLVATDNDDDPEFGKQLQSIPDANLSITIADSDEHQLPIDILSTNKEDLFIPVMSKSKRKYERKKAKAQAAAAAKQQHNTVTLDK